MSGVHARPRRSPLMPAAAASCFVVGCVAAAAALGAPQAGLTDASATRPVVTATADPTAVTAPVTAPSVSASPSSPRVATTVTHPLDEADSVWVVVNKSRPLDPETYEPDDLASLDEVPGGGSQRLRSEAADAFVAMSQAAADAGAGFSVSTAYRSYGFQQSLFGDYADTYGVDSAESFSARAGYSEHQTGLAADVYASSACRIEQCFADEPAGEWVAEHAWEHGFIVRYPEGEEDVTGYVFEPWHVRYVGAELAADMHEAGVTTLEQWFDLPAAPDYE